MNSRLVYEDLKHLGAGHDFLMNSVRGQVGKVFKAPAAVGTVAIYLFYCLILYMNDGGRFTPGELAGLGSCAAVVGVVTLCIWGFYICPEAGMRKAGNQVKEASPHPGGYSTVPLRGWRIF